MRHSRKGGESVREIAARHGRHPRTVGDVVVGRIYKEVGGPLVPPRARLSDNPPEELVRAAAEERLLARREITHSGCWLYTRGTTSGYGSIRVGREYWTVHRLAWTLWRGEIPSGVVLDHICHNADLECAGGVTCDHRRCFNPDHLRITDHVTNMMAGVLGRRERKPERCRPRGHLLDERTAFLYVDHKGATVRGCGQCVSLQYNAWQAQLAAAALLAGVDGILPSSTGP